VTPRPAAVVGVGMSEFRTRRDDEDLRGLIQEGAHAALADAGLEPSDVDAFVLAEAPDALHGIGHPEQLAAGALAIAGRPALRVNTGGATGASAAQLGWWAVASGRFDTVLVVGAEKMGDSTRGAQETLNKIWDPAYESLLPLNTIAMTALQVVRYMERHGSTEEQFAAIASRLRASGARNRYAHLREPVSTAEVMASPLLCWPVRRGMACPRSSGACAIVITSEERARRMSAPKAWIRSFAARSNTYFMGDKMGDAGLNDHGFMYDLKLAAEEAYAIAGIEDPAKEIDVAEPYVPFAPVEPGAVEALGLCAPGEGARLAVEGAWDADGGRVAVCPSGGVMCANPISVSALVRVAEAAQQVRGRADDHQVDGVRTAVAGGAGGSYQFFVVGVLSTEPERRP